MLEDDIIMESDGVLSEISYENFIDCIGGNLEEIIKKNEQLTDKKMKRQDQSKRKEAQNYRLSELIYIKTLAFGQFGPVYLCRSKFNGQLYVLKCFNKA